MFKIDILPIIRDHFSTLHAKGRPALVLFNVIIFFALPIAVGALAYRNGLSLDRESLNVTITFFGIFVALLLNIQVAVFAILQRKWEPPKDEREQRALEIKISQRREALGEFNANLAYLTLFCCVALAMFFPAYVMDWKGKLFTAVGVTVYAHFLLTLLTCIRASHALFQKEYGRS